METTQKPDTIAYNIAVDPPVVPIVTIKVPIDELRDLRLAISETNWTRVSGVLTIEKFAHAVDAVLRENGMGI